MMRWLLPRTVREWAAAAAVAALVASCAAPGPPMRPAPPSAPADQGPAILPQGAALECVPFARQVSGIEIFGDAHTWWAQAAGRYRRGSTPVPGAVLSLHSYAGPNRGHVAVVTRVLGPRDIWVDHANWHNRGEVAVRVPVHDVSPAGDWSRVRVWNVDAGRWGGTSYQAHGFILPGPG